MHLTDLFLLVTLTGAYAFDVDARLSTPLQKRALQSCEESHGPGSQQCGPAESGYCFNPTEGQTCCAETDFSFCNDGSWCAPVAGYCCLESETLEACAANAGFNAPAATASTDSENAGFTASTFGRKHRVGKNRNQTTPITNNGTQTIRPSGTGAAGIALPTGTGVGNVRGNGTRTPVPVSQAQSDTRGVVFSLAIAVVVAVFLI